MSKAGGAQRKAKLEVISLAGRSSYTYKVETVTDSTFGWHFHSEVEINLVQKGSGMRFVGDSIEPFDDGDLVVLGPNLMHACPKPRTGEALHTIVIQFPMSLFEGPLQAMPEFRAIRGFLDKSRQGLKIQGPARVKAVEMMADMAKLPQGSAQCLAHLIALVSLLCEAVGSRTLVRGPLLVPEVRAGDVRLQKIFKTIHAQLPEVLSESDLAERMKMSAGAFSHFFRRSMGKSYIDYVIELRIGLACKSLMESDKPIVEVAFEAGFNNLSNFHRQFKKLKGSTPQAFRKLSREDAGFTIPIR